ncbi:MAG: DUF2304 family protein [Gammaproteobacteria bacterium]|nr:DUF2304 family protein [Gammaproteobacteria bacterium]
MIRLLAVGASLFIFALVLVLVRRRTLHEEHALAWLIGSGVIAAASAFPGVIETVADFVGVKNPPNLLLGATVFILAFVSLRQQVQISHLSDQTRMLTQELAILRLQTEQNQQREDKE